MKLEYELLINFSDTHLSLKIERFFCQGHSTIMKYLQMIIWLFTYIQDKLRAWKTGFGLYSTHHYIANVCLSCHLMMSNFLLPLLSLMYRFYAICLFTVLYPPKLLYNFNYFSGKLGVIIHKNEIVVEIFFLENERDYWRWFLPT